MWKLILSFNVLILALFWMLSQVFITPAHNLLVVYAESGADLPILTSFAIQSRSISACIPFVWFFLTIYLGWQLRKIGETKRNEWIFLHISLSLFLGLAMLFFYALAGILPILKFGAQLS